MTLILHEEAIIARRNDQLSSTFADVSVLLIFLRKKK